MTTHIAVQDGSEIEYPDSDCFLEYYTDENRELWSNLYELHDDCYLNELVEKLKTKGYNFSHLDFSYEILGERWVDINGFLFESPQAKLAFLLKWA
jgi:hypothetical protein